MQRGFYSDPNSLVHHFKVEIFRLLPRPFATAQHIGDVRREFIFTDLKSRPRSNSTTELNTTGTKEH